MALDSGGSLSDGWANVSSAPVFPVAIVLILAFNIACAFLDVWDMVIDTIFQCYCMDEEYGTGEWNQILLALRHGQLSTMIILCVSCENCRLTCQHNAWGTGKAPAEFKQAVADNPPKPEDLKAMDAVTPGGGTGGTTRDRKFSAHSPTPYGFGVGTRT